MAKPGKLQLNARAAARTRDADTPEVVTVEEQRTVLSLQIADAERRQERLDDLLLAETISSNSYTRQQRKVQLQLAALREELVKLPDPEVLRAYRTQLAELRKTQCCFTRTPTAPKNV